MKVIPFPNAAQARANKLQLKFSRPDTTHGNMHLGGWDFSCTRCDTATKIESKGLIFRTADFYCSQCGTLHRLTNPAFAAPNKDPKK